MNFECCESQTLSSVLVWENAGGSSTNSFRVKIVNASVIKNLFLNCYLVQKKVKSFEPLVVTSNSLLVNSVLAYVIPHCTYTHTHICKVCF